MQSRAIPLFLTGAALALACLSAMAAAETSAPAKSVATAPAPKAKKPKPVDINNATVEQLAKVPGLDKAHAMKIVANRPYPTRAWLVTKGILSETKYAEVKDYLVATPNTSPRAPTTK